MAAKLSKSLILLTAILFISACKLSDTQHSPKYAMIDYIEVGKLLDLVEPPYVIDLSYGVKRLVFIGCSHTRDSTDSQYAVIEQYFKEFKPQLALNEGGQLPNDLHFRSKSEAIEKRGENGFVKFLCDQSNIQMLNGDISDSLEFSIALQKHPKEDLFLYYMMERLVHPYLNNAYGDRPFEDLYDRVIDSWFIKPGFPLSEQEKSFVYFKQLYLDKIGRPFVLEANYDNIERFDYINGGDCKFCAIGRTSKMVRDCVLLDNIDKALDQYDRVIITFGHGHALAVEPALRQIIAKERK